MRTLTTSRLIRGCLLAAPLGLTGCVINPIPDSLSNKAVNYVQSRLQKPDDVQQTAGVLPPTTLADGTVAVRVVAYVNNSPVFETEWRDMVLQRSRELADLAEPERSRRLKKIQEEELEKLVEREAILEEATARLKKMRPKLLEDLKREANREYEKRIREIKAQVGVKSDEQFREFLAAQGMSLESIRRQSERGFLSNEYMRNMIFPKLQTIPLSEVRDYYDRHPDEFKTADKVKWLGIFVDASRFPDREAARQFADDVVRRLRAGQDFAAVAKQLQADGVNAALSPDGVGEKPGDIRPAEVEPTVLKLRAGDVGDPVEMPGGFHVVKVTERAYAGLKPFDPETQGEVRRIVQNLLLQAEYRRLVEEMKAKTVIQRLARE